MRLNIFSKYSVGLDQLLQPVNDFVDAKAIEWRVLATQVTDSGEIGIVHSNSHQLQKSSELEDITHDRGTLIIKGTLRGNVDVHLLLVKKNKTINVAHCK